METTFNPGYWADDELSKFGFRKVGTNVRVAKNCIIIGLDNISIGDNVRIDGPTVLSAASGYIRIGSHVHIGGMAFLAGGGGIELDDFSGLSQGVRIYSRRRQAARPVSDNYLGRSTGVVVAG